MSIYKACDIRGRFGEELEKSHAARLGMALGAWKGPGTVLVGGDARLSTPVLKEALISSLCQSGCDVIDLGCVPTPLFYFARRHLGIALGVMVTASHNPPQYNGFKITPGPMPITEEEMAALASRMEGAIPSLSTRVGKRQVLDLQLAYLDALEPYIPDLSGRRVVVDCAHGMGGQVARTIWQQTGAEVILLHEQVDGSFPAYSPNPAEVKNLRQLQHAVLASEAHLGVAYDGDADRVAFVDEKGQPLSPDRAIVLFARDALAAGPAAVVYDQKCSRVVPETIRSMGGRPIRELSGHTYIKRAFLEQNAVYAGELSGHHFFRAIQGDDGLYASLIFARLLRESQLPLSELAATVPQYPITPEFRLPVTPDQTEAVLTQLARQLEGQAFITSNDGLRIEFPHGWGLVRRSVTEPVITLRFEGEDLAALKQILHLVTNASPFLGPVKEYLDQLPDQANYT